MVAWAGYLGIGLYRNRLQIREENAHLIQKKKDLDELKLALKRIQTDEELIRNVLGLERQGAFGGALSQGGTSTTDLSSIAPEDALTSSSVGSIVQAKSYSILDQAKSLQKSLQELVGAVREQQQLLNSTPSIMPVAAEDYWLSSGFGWRRSPFTGLKVFHQGLDISAARGTPIIAPAEGLVIRVGKHRHRGRYLQLDHGRQRITTYAHLSGYKVRQGQKVKRGQVIAYVGNTGRSTGSHLHYEIEINGRVVNPKHYILNTGNKLALETLSTAEGQTKTLTGKGSLAKF
jgi:murein DD-endopeptidase MepM/ murein hydrolase activator NlpD